MAAAFGDWGVGTVDALRGALVAAPGLPVIATGGLRDGVEAAKCLALGASAAGLARPLLHAAQDDRAGETLATLLAPAAHRDVGRRGAVGGRARPGHLR